ncbi:hypothetical protein JMJ77_0013596 [Colletotrichum scovillei]|uniref:Uncharacterized protein n=1 Tax=Colletotrichum scovillei TaxID=1209932 RepID=A0A9P7UDA0_9PEZI|nr:hypothetical protein JMJ77_0013596 [Colletotrichum scovillei]KAG7069897.1 hypothetical protein JMJ76_0003557 [Colletotrichum scovillei]KAG7073863.1 hypothetical protein JMJ78_0014830 [Colletotrichum scovillei]
MSLGSLRKQSSRVSTLSAGSGPRTRSELNRVMDQGGNRDMKAAQRQLFAPVRDGLWVNQFLSVSTWTAGSAGLKRYGKLGIAVLKC